MTRNEQQEIIDHKFPIQKFYLETKMSGDLKFPFNDLYMCNLREKTPTPSPDPPLDGKGFPLSWFENENRNETYETPDGVLAVQQA